MIEEAAAIIEPYLEQRRVVASDLSVFYTILAKYYTEIHTIAHHTQHL
jgi:hypothetical protein